MFIDLTGQTFGRLTVTGRTERDNRGEARWRCTCGCGAEIVRASSLLRSNKIRSCGCLAREVATARLDAIRLGAEDLTGQTFGRLTVEARGENTDDNRVRWWCACACGSRSLARSDQLKSGNTRSCGCEGHVPEDVRAKLAADYAGGSDSREVAAKHGVGNDAVLRAVRRTGARVRTKAEARRVYQCDHHYFDVIDTEAKAYWLGFLAADGCVTSGNVVRLQLAAVDREHVVKFRAALGAGHPIQVRNYPCPRGSGRSFPQATFALASTGLASGLARHGVVPRKSLIAEPAALRVDLMRHYWRGLVDGDGCICIIARGAARGAPIVDLTGSRAIVDGFADFARALTGSRAAVRQQSRGRAFTFAVAGVNVARTLLRAMYEGATVSLDRKRAMYERVLRIESRGHAHVRPPSGSAVVG